MYLRLVFIHLWLILSERVGLRSHVFGCRACGRVSVAGCERLAMGPAGATSQISLVRRGNVAGSAGQAGSTTSVTGLVLVRQGCVAGALGRRRHLGAGPTSSSVRGRGQVLVDACCL